MNVEEKTKLKNAITSGDCEYLNDLDAKNGQWQIEILDATELQMPHCFAVHLAAYYQRLSVIQLALTVAPELIDFGNIDGETLVIIASMLNNLDILNYLIDIKADLNQASTGQCDYFANDQSPIAWATTLGNTAVVKRLIEVGVDYKRVINHENGAQLIHIACCYGYLDLVEYFISLQPEMLTSHFKALMTVSLHYRQADVVSYLLKEKRKNEPKSKEIDEKTIFNYFKESRTKQFWDVASVLLLHMLEGQPPCNYTPYANTPGLIIELMLHKPSLNPTFGTVPSILSVLKESGYEIIDGRIEFYRTRRERSLSFFVQFDMKNPKNYIYRPVKWLGKGRHGEVSKFVTEEGNAIAVKKPLENYASKSDAINSQKCMDKDKQFNALLYPDKGVQRSYLFDNGGIFSSRQLMSYVEGENFWNLARTLTSEQDLATCALKISQELQRFHDNKVVNGDLGSSNIMLEKKGGEWLVRFVDLDHSYYLTDESARLWNHLPVDKIAWYPPELANPEVDKVAPHVNQNVYSLAYVFDSVFCTHPLKTQLYSKYPSIQNFITTGLATDPNQRGNLKDFIMQLALELTNLDEVESTGFTITSK